MRGFNKKDFFFILFPRQLLLRRLERLLLVLYLLGNCSMRYSTSYIPVVVHGPG